MIATPLRTRVEKTYSAPFAAYLYAKETVELPDGGQGREFPRLKFGGAHLQDPETQLVGDVVWRAALGGGLGLLLWCLIIVSLTACSRTIAVRRSCRHLCGIWRGSTAVPWNSICITLALMLLLWRRGTGVMRQLPYFGNRQGGAGRVLSVAEKYSHGARDRNAYHADDAAFCAASGDYGRLFSWLGR